MDESNANFIPLGSGSAPISRPGFGRPASISSRHGPKVIGQTKEEYKRIAREIRLAAKKAKKKEKADAKRARKLNGILHRRMTKNPEKYHKNKDRNRERAIQLERQKIQYGAVHQCERLAAEHDPTGALFNVGEVIVTPEGKVKSKEALKREAEREAEKKAEKEAEALQPRNKRISKNQLKRQEMLKPKPVPPKPVIPDGYSLPEGEENFVALFDITDQEIEARLRRQKSQKRQAAKDLRKIQKEKKKLNRAMKLRKKQCAYAGVTWDPERARREIIGQMTNDDEDDSDSDSDSGSSDDESDNEGETNGNAEDTPKDSKDNADSSDRLPNGKKKKPLPEIQRPRLNLELIAKAEEIERQRQEKKLIARQRRREERKRKAEEEARKAEEARLAEEARKAELGSDDENEKKRKRSDDDDDEADATPKKERYRKKKKVKAEKVETEDVDMLSENAQPEAPATEPVEDAEDPDIKAAEAMGLSLKKYKKKLAKGAITVPDAGEEEEPVKKKKKRDHKEAEFELPEAEVEKKEKKKKRKLEESNDDKLDRQIAEREAAMKSKNERDGEDVQNGAEQWNPDALSGDAARKDKFLRLLGANKNGEPDHKRSKKSKSKDKNAVEEITKVQTELEQQYEAGMKMKHDGGSKRRGLGA